MMNSFRAVVGSAASVLIFVALPLAVVLFLVRGWIKQPAGTGVRGWLARVGRGAALASAGLGLFLDFAVIRGGSWTEPFTSGGTLVLPIIRAGTYLGLASLVLSVWGKSAGRWRIAVAALVMVVYWFAVFVFQ